METVVKDFLVTRKADQIKKKITASMTEEQRLIVEQEAEQIFSLESWLPDAAKRAGQLSMVTHPGKFSHPSAKISPVIAEAPWAADGFLRTGNVPQVEPDVLGNAAAIDVFKFLSLELSDAKTILQHLEGSSGLIQRELRISSASFEELRTGFLKIKEADATPQTSDKIKQVYFPVAEGQYHLISLLTPSALVFKFKDYIHEMRFSEQAKEAREAKKKGSYHAIGFEEIYGLAMIGYGGTKPQNISVLNSANGGKAYLLPSLPPEISLSRQRLPKYDFFREILWSTKFKKEFHGLQKACRRFGERSLVHEQRNAIIQDVIEQAITKMWEIRAQEAGWSSEEKYCDLPEYQRMWLDESYKEVRQEGEWLDKVIDRFSRWFLDTYEYILGENAARLDDIDMDYFRRMIKKNREDLL